MVFRLTNGMELCSIVVDERGAQLAAGCAGVCLAIYIAMLGDE